MKKEKAFNNWRHNSIHLTFPNGNILSTVWGVGTYSDNHDFDFTPDPSEGFRVFMQSDEVEISILKAPAKLVKKIMKKYDVENDSVIGYLNMAQWLDIVKMLSK